MQRRVIRKFSQRGAYHARTGNTDIQHDVRFTDAMESACHKRIILRRVAEYDQLSRADALPVLGQFRCFAHDLAHHGNRVHIDAGLGGTDVDGGTDEICLRERARNGRNQFAVPGTEALLYQRAIAADEIDADVFGSAIQCLGIFDRVTAADRDEHRDRGNTDALINNRNPVFFFNLLAGCD